MSSSETEHVVTAEEDKANVTTRRPTAMSRSNKGQTERRKINVKVPPFSPEEPGIWFALLEGQFEVNNITDDIVMYNNVISNLDLLHAKEVKDIITKPPAQGKYHKIKHELIKRLSASHERKVKQLLMHEQLGDRKPSQFLRHLQDLAGPGIPDDFVRTIWSNRLSGNIQTVLASQTTQTMDELAELADRIHDITTPSPSNVAALYSPSQPTNEIAELKRMVEQLAVKLDEHTRSTCNAASNRSRPQQRRQGNSRQRTRSNSSYRKFPVCWYHATHGSKALKCIKPCDFGKSGNASGSR